MNDEDVTHVTRNAKRDYSELKLLVDVVTGVAALYYMTHPDCLDGLGEKVNKWRAKLAHKVSVWATRWDIRTLPETDE